jgi:hypothetical protein
MKRAIYCGLACALAMMAIVAGCDRAEGQKPVASNPATRQSNSAVVRTANVPATRPAQKPDPRTHYAVIAESNIFLKERRSSRGGRDERPTSRQYTPPVPEKTFVLTGIVLEDEWRAYVEETAARTRFHRVGVGDQLGRGHVAAIEIDAIAYEYGGKITWVPIGKDLTGDAPPSTASAYVSSTGTNTTTAPTTGPTTGPAAADTVTTAPLPIDPNNPNLSLEERMKLRRQMEQKK